MNWKIKLGIIIVAVLVAATCVYLGLRCANIYALCFFGAAFLAAGLVIGAHNWKHVENAKEKAENLIEKQLGTK